MQSGLRYPGNRLPARPPLSRPRTLSQDKSGITRGRAMNAGRTPAIGTVLGKALGVLEHGSGTIPMLVMLR